jgi:hypothetical protein
MSTAGTSALCHVCGCVRRVKVTREGRYRPAGFDVVDATCDLRCRSCGAVTRHALCFGDDRAARQGAGPGSAAGGTPPGDRDWHADVERGLRDARTWAGAVGAASVWNHGFAAGAGGRAGYVAGVYAGLVAAHDHLRAESWRSGAKAGERGDTGSRRAEPAPRG